MVVSKFAIYDGYYFINHNELSFFVAKNDKVKPFLRSFSTNISSEFSLSTSKQPFIFSFYQFHAFDFQQITTSQKKNQKKFQKLFCIRKSRIFAVRFLREKKRRKKREKETVKKEF
jgi:hypothetical protein